ncbi:hypothetical protein MD484_g8042, partial [Candolleomyces efflorescens]
MDRHYRYNEAKAWLHSYAAQANQGTDGPEHLANVNLEGKEVMAFKEPRCYRLVTATGGENDEVVVKIPGVLCRAVDTDEHVRKLRQFIKLTGFSSPAFDCIQGKICEVVALFSAAIQPGRLLDVVFNGYDGHNAVDAHTRYFTERRQAPSLAHQAFALDVDPLNVLEELRGGKYIHTDENVVQYVRKEQASGRESSYTRVSPTVFKEGDIAEVWAAFTAFPVSKTEYKLVLSMRMLVLLTTEHREAAEARKAEARAMRLQVQRDARAGTTMPLTVAQVERMVIQQGVYPNELVALAPTSQGVRLCRFEWPENPGEYGEEEDPPPLEPEEFPSWLSERNLVLTCFCEADNEHGHRLLEKVWLLSGGNRWTNAQVAVEKGTDKHVTDEGTCMSLGLEYEKKLGTGNLRGTSTRGIRPRNREAPLGFLYRFALPGDTRGRRFHISLFRLDPSTYGKKEHEPNSIDNDPVFRPVVDTLINRAGRGAIITALAGGNPARFNPLAPFTQNNRRHSHHGPPNSNWRPRAPDGFANHAEQGSTPDLISRMDTGGDQMGPGDDTLPANYFDDDTVALE